MYKKFIIFALVFVFIVSGIAITYGKTKRLHSYSYDDFHEVYTTILRDYRPDNYSFISKNTESQIIAVFPEGLQLEKRKALCFEDNPVKPNKFEVFYEDKEEESVIKLNLLFTPNNPNKGIAYYQVISPEDNIILEDSYAKIPRPIMVETYESFGEFGILVNAIAIDNDSNKTIEEKTRNVILKNWDFVKKTEEFLLNKNIPVNR
jgi:hypothetical protein